MSHCDFKNLISGRQSCDMKDRMMSDSGGTAPEQTSGGCDYVSFLNEQANMVEFYHLFLIIMSYQKLTYLPLGRRQFVK